MTFRSRGGGLYDVVVDGQVIGTVRKWERRYNLRRVYVSRGWRALAADGERLYGQDGYTADTRREAAEVLQAHCG